ncbi:MAG: hypothetical protein ACYC9Q_04480 [Bacillota bacterium]
MATKHLPPVRTGAGPETAAQGWPGKRRLRVVGRGGAGGGSD